jgi:hypothetical protein
MEETGLQRPESSSSKTCGPRFFGCDKSTRPRILDVSVGMAILPPTDHPYQRTHASQIRASTKMKPSLRANLTFDDHKIQAHQRQMWRAGCEKGVGEPDQAVQGAKYSDKFCSHACGSTSGKHPRASSQGRKCQIYTWRLSGIVDWAGSGYCPEYMEYATVMKGGPIDPYWRKALRKVSKGLECSSQRWKGEKAATYWYIYDNSLSGTSFTVRVDMPQVQGEKRSGEVRNGFFLVSQRESGMPGRLKSQLLGPDIAWKRLTTAALTAVFCSAESFLHKLCWMNT